MMRAIWIYEGPRNRNRPARRTVQVVAVQRRTAKIRYLRASGKLIERYTKLDRLQFSCA